MTYTLHISNPSLQPTHFDLPDGRYLIGRGDSCAIRLRAPEISEHHACLTLTRHGAMIEDLQSANGTLLNASPLTRPTPLAAGASITLGPYTLKLFPKTEAVIAPTAPTPPTTPVAEQKPAPIRQAEPQPAKNPKDPLVAIRREVKNQIHREVIQRMDLRRMTAARVNTEELQTRTRETIRAVIQEIQANQRLPKGIDPAQLETQIYNEAMKLGPLEDYLEDDSITEIMINGPTQIYVERNGKLTLTGDDFMDETSVLAIIERIVAPIGRRIDESSPYVDARLPDGSRVNAIIPPLSLIGPCITIRKFSKRNYTDQDLINFGTWTDAITQFLNVCVKLRKNIIVAGGTGSGKTTLLNVLSAYLPVTERILTIEDAAELRLTQPHVIRLEARPPNIEGRGAITIRDLVRNALRMRPDRIIVGECRGGESLDMLQAMNTGHDGSLTTVHANSPRDVISRLETMVLMSGMDLPSKAIREQIASAVDIIVHESRLSDGSRKVTTISEVVGQEGSQIVMQDIFEYKQTGLSDAGKVVGHFTPTGAIPTFLEDLKARGLELSTAIFQPVNR